MTPSTIIAEVRTLIQDTKAPFRYSDSVLLGFVNQTLQRMAVLRPDLFSEIADLPTTPNVVLQSLPPGSVRLVEIYQVKNGNVVTEVNRDMLDRSTPSWVSDPAGTPVNYVRHPRNPYKFFVYPRPAPGVVLIAEYAKTPPTYTLAQTITVLPEAYFPVIVDGTVFLAESIDNEYVNSGRAKLFQDAFTQALGVGLQSRTITDTEASGQDPREVV